MAAAVGTAHAEPDCAALTSANIPSTTVESAERTPATFTINDTYREGNAAPVTVNRSFCRVKGLIKPSPTSQIHFEVWLPDDWNGDYFQTGNGGLAGTIRYPEIAHALNRGFASASTDDGTSRSNFAWAIDPERMLDFRDRAVHYTAVAGQKLTEIYYGREAGNRFFLGGSKGGQEAMNEVQRYPEDFDGVVALYPATRGEFQAASTLWYAQQMTRTPGSLLKEPQLRLLHTAALRACAGTDGGLKSDWFLTDPRKCKFDPQRLQCKPGQSDDCLTAEQVITAKALYAGPKNFPELRMLPGGEWPQLGNLHGWSVLDGTLVKAFSLELSIGQGVFHQPKWTYRDFDIDRDMPRLIESSAPSPGNTFDPDLKAFQARGGKLILIHGWSDPMVPSLHSPLYWDRVVADQAEGRTPKEAVARTRQFLRLFMVPGYGHGYGDGLEPADPLTAIVKWVKTDTPPETLQAVAYEDSAAWAAASRSPSAFTPDEARDRPVRLTRKLCAWPAKAEITAKETKCKLP
ncbi:tannase/feruloyl esterase family alpha/beta hydrolase [Novosphingobium pentaromativorans]|uniref:Feruloyl esterase n=2 Tax=Novosphingobium pentaromativorans TaxID=205844 RepID=G6EE15_9SPHN|nr:tannase/feruloyl esterase family alpha/beta hydrolase [Novosphingobium pentaromativorans]AIT79574.1 hypothetical protein JI59_07135 [Novosphingobium pentaromativorans US6-1]EHJ60456.1 hypothetical protein NSU_2586 [Novosphingobium pentaromativorans US6-1]